MQRRATKLPIDASSAQLTLLPERRTSDPVDLGRIRRLKSTRAALNYACELVGLEPKEIYADIPCDKGVWSRICSGEFDLDGRDIPRFNQVVGNDAYLLYLVHIEGYDLDSLRKQQDDKDRRIAELEKHVADQDRAIRLMVEYNRGGRGG
jgi:hypothetical protein